jgi:predicted RNase H-like HicB family nuclease
MPLSLKKHLITIQLIAPDLPGCAATGATLAEVQQQIKEAIEFHLEGLREEGLPIPEPTTLCDYVEAR